MITKESPMVYYGILLLLETPKMQTMKIIRLVPVSVYWERLNHTFQLMLCGVVNGASVLPDVNM